MIVVRVYVANWMPTTIAAKMNDAITAKRSRCVADRRRHASNIATDIFIFFNWVRFVKLSSEKSSLCGLVPHKKIQPPPPPQPSIANCAN